MAEAVQTGILGFAIAVDDTRSHLGRMEAVLDDGVAVLDIAATIRKRDVLIVVRGGKTMLA